MNRFRPFSHHASSRGRLVVTRLALAACLALWVTGTSFAQSQEVARSFLWKATRGDGVVYLVGSMHMLTKNHYPLNPAMEAAFAASDLLVEEVDLGVLLTPESQLELLNRSLLPGNQLLDQLISEETRALVASRVGKLGLPLDPLLRFKPWGLAVMLLGIQWQQAGFDQSLGLDQHFYERARGSGKVVQGLETVDFQISRFDALSAQEQEQLLAETLRELDTQMAAVTELADAWKTGDVAVVEDLVLRDLRQEPHLYELLLVERNRAWFPAIEALFSRSSPSFVVVGAAHLVGPDGLVAMLRARGYTVEQR